MSESINDPAGTAPGDNSASDDANPGFSPDAPETVLGDDAAVGSGDPAASGDDAIDGTESAATSSHEADIDAGFED